MNPPHPIILYFLLRNTFTHSNFTDILRREIVKKQYAGNSSSKQDGTRTR